MLVQRNQLSELFHLQQFTLDHLLRQLNQHVKNAEISLLHRDLECLHVKPVARQHTFRVAPLGVGCWPAASDLGIVDDVIMYERSSVNDFHDCSQPDSPASL